MAPPVTTARALAEGARRSREACSVQASAPVTVRIWRRHRWTIIAVLIFLLIDLVLMGGLGSTIATHF